MICRFGDDFVYDLYIVYDFVVDDLWGFGVKINWWMQYKTMKEKEKKLVATGTKDGTIFSPGWCYT